MKAMIFAAGLGTRLSPITDTTPKALVKIGEQSLLEILIKKLIAINIRDIIINVHHFPGQILSFLEKHNNFDINIEISDETGELLETGGGIKKAAWFFNDGNPFLVHNVDILSDIDLEKMIKHHKQSGNMATLAVRSRKSSRYLLVNQHNKLCGWENITTNEQIIVRKDKVERFAFSGIHIIDPKLFAHFTESGKFSIITTYLRLAKQFDIGCYNHDSSFWLDVGKPESIGPANEFLKYS